MGLPEPIEPRPDEAAEAGRGEGRADWLCGAEEGLEAELGRSQDGGGHGSRPAPKLFRPGADAAAEPAPTVRPQRRDGPPPEPVRLTLPAAPAAEAPPTAAPRRAPAVEPDEAGSGFSHGPAMLWEPGANSVPSLSRERPAPLEPRAVTPAPAAAPAAEDSLDFPMDDAEERARATAEAAAAAAAREAQPHAVVTPEAFDIKDAPVPWWMQLPQMLREDRRTQAIVAGVAVVLLAIVFWPKPEKSLSIASIRRDPQRYDGQDVRVSGRIGETFQVGGGHAFYLHQGRDTLVVFSRSRTPRRGQGVSLVGMISTGYLNGQSGTALFEAAKKK